MLQELNFVYERGFDYETYYPCPDNPEICADDYCRCGQIIGVTTPKVIDSFKIASKLDFAYLNLTKIDQYVIERFVKLNVTPNSFTFNAEGGYYGEEIESIYLQDGKRYDEELSKILQLPSDLQKILKILNLEYDYTPESLDAIKSVSIQPVILLDIELPNPNHLKKISNAYRDCSMDERGIPIGILKKTPKGYSMVDGYHRYNEALFQEFTSANYVILKES